MDPSYVASKEPNSLYISALGQALREMREGQDISQERLGDMADMHRTFVSQIERGVGNPSMRSLLKVCSALGEPFSTLVAMAERQLGKR